MKKKWLSIVLTKENVDGNLISKADSYKNTLPQRKEGTPHSCMDIAEDYYG